jgi:hypothetical protein
MCYFDDHAQVTNPLQSDTPAAETKEQQDVAEPTPMVGTASECCLEKWTAWTEGENFSGTVVRTQPLEFAFDNWSASFQ